MNKNPGTLVISLDFELMWGMFDKVTVDTYGQNLRGVHTALPKTLDLFLEYGIHATWATVGMLMYADKQRLLEAVPDVVTQPNYTNQNLSAYHHLNQKLLPDGDPHYFAPELVRKIIDTPGQELASHTFSHYYYLEEQIGGEGGAFAADCTAMQKVADQFQTKLMSIVFPRNQYNDDALAEIKKFDITAYRGTEDHLIYRARNENSKTNLILRACRLLDRYLNLTGNHTYSTIDHAIDGLSNVPASRQLIPYSKKLAPLESLRLRRIKKAMTYAAENREIFHIWWHPHNFGINQEQNFALLTKILDHYRILQKKYDMRSMSMKEVATQNGESTV